MINVTLPDGSKRELPDGATPLDLAEGISKSLAKAAVDDFLYFDQFDGNKEAQSVLKKVDAGYL